MYKGRVSLPVHPITSLALRCKGTEDGCCTEANPCQEGEGDCDGNNQCAGSLVCGENMCPKRSPFDDTDDCCVKPDGKLFLAHF